MAKHGNATKGAAQFGGGGRMHKLTGRGNSTKASGQFKGKDKKKK